jgi:adenosylhomocysteine nucleosidase
MIAVTFALPAESSLFVSRLMKKRRSKLSNGEVIYAEMAQRAIVVLHTGVGPKVCERRVREFFAREDFDSLISAGFAGGVNEEYEVGDLLLAENFSDPRLISIAQDTLRDRKVHTGILFTSNMIVDSAHERSEIARAHRADAVDMETEIIAQAAAACAIPVLAIRALSDTAREPLPAPPSVLFDLERQKINLGQLATHLMTRPATIGPMFRFALGVKRARKNLTAALTSLLQRESQPPP